MKKYKIGYTQGTFDLFHVGHLNLLERAKEQCEYLIVGVNSDELVQKYKNKKPVIRDVDRTRILEALKIVDEVHITTTLDKITALEKYNFDVIFVGDDWKESNRWKQTEDELSLHGIDVIFLPYTKGISSSQLIRIIKTRGGGVLNNNKIHLLVMYKILNDYFLLLGNFRCVDNKKYSINSHVNLKRLYDSYKFLHKRIKCIYCLVAELINNMFCIPIIGMVNL